MKCSQKYFTTEDVISEDSEITPEAQRAQRENIFPLKQFTKS
jgi:hypothetical protein